MQKTKLALVTLLSLLVVMAPVCSVLAETEDVSQPVKQETKEEEVETENSVFEKIEAQGGNEVNEERLGEAEGEIAWWAVQGAVGGLITYSAFNYNSWNPREAVRAAGKGVLGNGLMTSAGSFFGGLFS